MILKRIFIFGLATACIIASNTKYAYASENTNSYKWSYLENKAAWQYKGTNNDTYKGWLYNNNAWYYLDKNTGYMKTSWLQTEDGKWYFLDSRKESEGKLLSSWQWIDGYCYYFEKDDAKKFGQLYLSTKTPDNYNVDASGRWVDEKGIPYFYQGRGIRTSKIALNNKEDKNNKKSGGQSKRATGSGGSGGGGSSSSKSYRVRAKEDVPNLTNINKADKASGESKADNTAGKASGESKADNIAGKASGESKTDNIAGKVTGESKADNTAGSEYTNSSANNEINNKNMGSDEKDKVSVKEDKNTTENGIGNLADKESDKKSSKDDAVSTKDSTLTDSNNKDVSNNVEGAKSTEDDASDVEDTTAVDDAKNRGEFGNNADSTSGRESEGNSSDNISENAGIGGNADSTSGRKDSENNVDRENNTGNIHGNVDAENSSDKASENSDAQNSSDNTSENAGRENSSNNASESEGGKNNGGSISEGESTGNNGGNTDGRASEDSSESVDKDNTSGSGDSAVFDDINGGTDESTQDDENMEEKKARQVLELLSSGENKNVVQFIDDEGNTRTVLWVHGITSPKLGENGDFKRTNFLSYVDYKAPYLEGNSWYDINKSRGENGEELDDQSMCFAAVASNALHWWMDQNRNYIDRYIQLEEEKGNFLDNSLKNKFDIRDFKDSFLNQQQSKIYSFFKANFRNKTRGFYSDILVDFFINGYTPKAGGGTNLEDEDFVPDKRAGFLYSAFKEKKVTDRAYRANYSRFGKDIRDILGRKEIIGLGHFMGRNSHVVTLWGAEYDLDGNIVGIYVTDSDDQFEDNVGMKRYDVKNIDNYPRIGTNRASSGIEINYVESIGLGTDIWENYFKN